MTAVQIVGAIFVLVAALFFLVWGTVLLVLSGRGEMDWDVPYLPVDELSARQETQR